MTVDAFWAIGAEPEGMLPLWAKYDGTSWTWTPDLRHAYAFPYARAAELCLEWDEVFGQILEWLAPATRREVRVHRISLSSSHVTRLGEG